MSRKTITKEIRVQVCDSCGLEQELPNESWSFPKCVSCRKEICPGCSDTLRVEVQRYGKRTPMGNGCHSTTQRIEPVLGTSPKDTSYYATYCPTCARSIEENLLRFGFIPKQSEPSGTTTLDHS